MFLLRYFPDMKQMFFVACLAGWMLTACDNHFDVQKQLTYCDVQVHRTLDELRSDSGTYDYTLTPRNIADSASVWTLCRADTPEEWTAGFWPGILWLDFAATDDQEVMRAAMGWTEQLRFLAYSPIYDHDLGFIMIGSYMQGVRQLDRYAEMLRDAGETELAKVAAQRRDDYKRVLHAAADSLATLFNPHVGTLLSWPRNVKMFGGHNTIMDNIINLELLFWANQDKSEPRLYDMAVSHADTTLHYQFRPDGSCYHVAVYNPVTGRHLRNCTHQGAGDETMWARGQAWAIYGYTMVYQYTHEQRFLDFAQKAADVYLRQLPDSTLIPYWDFSMTDYRDASAAAVVASALIPLAAYADNAEYLAAARTMLCSLSSSAYRSGDAKPSFLRHCVGNYPSGSEIDYSINYGDYYYLEALLRMKKASGN